MIVDRQDLPTKSGLRAAIDEALPEAPAEVRDALFVRAVELAKLAEDRGARFDLRGSADRLVLQALRGLEAADRLVDDEDEDVTPEDVSGALDAIDNFDPTRRPRTAAELAAIKAADTESAKRLA